MSTNNDLDPLKFKTTTNARSSPYFASDIPIELFTSVGKLFKSSKSKNGPGMNSAESGGIAPPDLRPSPGDANGLVFIAVMLPEDVVHYKPRHPKEAEAAAEAEAADSPVEAPPPPYIDNTATPTTQAPVESTSTPIPATLSSDPIIHNTSSSKRSLKFWKSPAKPSTNTTSTIPQPASSTPSASTSAPKKAKPAFRGPSAPFTMKQVTRAEYAKHYAKDEAGRYIGDEEPADDCILQHEEDARRWRGGAAWQNDTTGKGLQGATAQMASAGWNLDGM